MTMMTHRDYVYDFFPSSPERRARAIVPLNGGDVVIEVGSEEKTESATVSRRGFARGIRFLDEIVLVGAYRRDVGDRAATYAEGAVAMLREQLFAHIRLGQDVWSTIRRELATTFYVGFHAGKEDR